MEPIDFKNLSFTCSREEDHVPPPTAKAQELFDKALAMHKQATERESADVPLMKEAIKVYEVAAQEGHWKAVRNLANIYAFGVPGGGVDSEPAVKPNGEKALKYTKQLIDMNVATGFNLMAVFAGQGWGVRHDEKASLMYFRRAADLGMPQAQRQLGNKFRLEFNALPPEQRSQMETVGREMLACAVRQGDLRAALELAVEYANAKNYPYALFYYQQGGKMGDLTCLIALRDWFKVSENGYVADLERAKRYYALAERASRREGPFPELDEELPLPPPPSGGSYPPPEMGWPNAWTKL